ncbi:hypothetical protein OE88DRAFT_1537635 [Heliocybe sulcata]|uniref:Uncharacterized protein n=1 Tax=Heliocybe sulcata TaxID=5364 RepID=A0A5C3N2T6_9AGAM|nr:hypothetical protein OE88DRAFT_1537635 [Heliocybe sulcata]
MPLPETAAMQPDPLPLELLEYRFRTLALTSLLKIQPFLHAFEDSAIASKRSVRHVFLTIEAGLPITVMSRWYIVTRFLEAIAANVETLVLSTEGSEYGNGIVQALMLVKLGFPRLTHLTLVVPWIYHDIPHHPASAPPFMRHELCPGLTHIHFALGTPMDLLSSYKPLSCLLSLSPSASLQSVRLSGISGRGLPIFLRHFLRLREGLPPSGLFLPFPMHPLPLSVRSCIIQLGRDQEGMDDPSTIPELTDIISMNNERGSVKFKLLPPARAMNGQSRKEIWLQVQAHERDIDEDWKLDSDP